MFRFNQLGQIHLEITNRCQASCPQCARTGPGGSVNPRLKLADWTLDQFKQIISPEVLSQIQHYYFCGNYGDPLLNGHLIPMIEYSREVNPRVRTCIYTNGSLRSPEWWRQLARALPPNHRVIFGIDGLADTHAVYRVGTDFDRVVANAQTFIEAGGRAEWAFIRFRHNEHQVDRARELAGQTGFEAFTMKDSGRFWLDLEWPVKDRAGHTQATLEPSRHTAIRFFDRQALKSYQQVVKSTEIACTARASREVYIDAHGQVYPCCFLGIVPDSPLLHPEFAPVQEHMLGEHAALMAALGGEQALNAHHRSIKDIIESPAYQTIWDGFWQQGQLTTCAGHCGVNTPISRPEEMFVERTSLAAS